MIRKKQRFFILDYETTGVDMDTDLPIEVGIIVTDEHFNLIETYESLIKWPESRMKEVDDPFFANTVHKIHPSDIQNNGKIVNNVADDIVRLALKHTTISKPILLSDNLQFEWGFTEKLIKHLGTATNTDYFHYCGWDSSLFLEVAGVGDPKAVHRALPDAGLLHAAILKSIGKINGS